VDYSPTEAEIKTCYQKGRFHAKSYHPHPEKQNEPVSKKKCEIKLGTVKIWTYLLFDAFLFTCQGISTTNKQQTFDFGEVSEFWGFQGGGFTVFSDQFK
jgi:hypothetical protein